MPAGKIKGGSKVRPIVLLEIGVHSILLDPAVTEIFYFKRCGLLILIFIGNPNVDNIGDAIPAPT